MNQMTQQIKNAFNELKAELDRGLKDKHKETEVYKIIIKSLKIGTFFCWEGFVVPLQDQVKKLQTVLEETIKERDRYQEELQRRAWE